MKKIYRYQGELSRRISQEIAHIPKTNEWSHDVVKRLTRYANRGKLLRGCLLVAACEQNGGELTDDVWKAAVALELIQSGLLILDDIMDNDAIRRGEPALHVQYSDVLDSDHAGASMGSCVSTITYFWAYKILAEISDPVLAAQIIKMFSEEFAAVGFGQMQDVAYSGAKQPHSFEDVIDVYTYKTARYTFSVPLMIGMVCAQQPTNLVHAVGNIGEQVGVLFQIKDDELGIFGSEKILGKPIGSDIMEGKKTLYWFNYVNASEAKENIVQLFGQDDLSLEQIEAVRTAMIASGVVRSINEYVDTIYEKASVEITNLGSSEEFKHSLKAMMDYLMVRRS